MKLYDIKCPVCQHLNKGVYITETKGWMVCEHCQANVGIPQYMSEAEQFKIQLALAVPGRK